MKRHYIIGSIIVCILIIGCARIPKVVYFNDSDKIYSGLAFKGVCASVNFDCVVMSKGQFRNITNVNVEGEKTFKLNYE